MSARSSPSSWASATAPPGPACSPTGREANDGAGVAGHAATLGSLIHGMTPADQTFILHALDGSWRQRGVRQFYEDFIATTPHPHLVEVARRYAGMLAE